MAGHSFHFPELKIRFSVAAWERRIREEGLKGSSMLQGDFGIHIADSIPPRGVQALALHELRLQGFRRLGDIGFHFSSVRGKIRSVS